MSIMDTNVDISQAQLYTINEKLKKAINDDALIGWDEKEIWLGTLKDLTNFQKEKLLKLLNDDKITYERN